MQTLQQAYIGSSLTSLTNQTEPEPEPLKP